MNPRVRMLMRRRTIEVIRYRRTTFAGERISNPVENSLTQSVLEHLARDVEQSRYSAPSVVNDQSRLPVLSRKESGARLTARLLRTIEKFRNR
jgi:hypothetical protein